VGCRDDRKLGPESPPDIPVLLNTCSDSSGGIPPIAGVWLQSPQIKFQRRIFFGFRAARLLKFSITLPPSVFSRYRTTRFQNESRCATRSGPGFSGKPKRLVNFKSVMRIQFRSQNQLGARRLLRSLDQKSPCPSRLWIRRNDSGRRNLRARFMGSPFARSSGPRLSVMHPQ